jgi:imidazole glycerol-phosphate synthase subunit HisH
VQIAVIDSGSGNLRSVQRALMAVGGEPVLTSDPDRVRKADRIVLPGQGAFGDCMDNLRSRGLEEAIREVVRAGKPYFGICLGLQILFASSEESPASPGLALLPGRVRRFAPTAGKVPHMGWNSVSHAGAASLGSDPLLAGIPDQTYFYFTHSFYAETDSDELACLRCDYGGDFVAAVRKDNLFACQFHPEKSQGAGLKLLANFIAC